MHHDAKDSRSANRSHPAIDAAWSLRRLADTKWGIAESRCHGVIVVIASMPTDGGQRDASDAMCSACDDIT